MKGKLLSVVSFALVAGLAGCEDDPLEPELELGFGPEAFVTFDLNNDEVLDFDEFEAGFVSEGVFATFDVNNDAFLDAEEFTAFDRLGALTAFDTDADAVLTRDEFLLGTFGAFDTDDDTLVTETEFEFGLDLF